MQQWYEFFSRLMDTSDWPPRWQCGKWSDVHGWLYIASDLLIWSSYFIIPLVILRFIIKKNDLRFFRIYILFATFIFACGTTHLLDALIFWWPAYRISALVRLFTGLVSWVTVFALIQNLPRAFALKSPEELEGEVETRKKAEASLAIRNKQLNEAQEIAGMGSWEWEYGSERVFWSDSLFKIYGLPRAEYMPLNGFFASIHPDDLEFSKNQIEMAVQNKYFPDFFHRIVLPSGDIKTIHARGEVISDEEGNVVRLIGTGQDVTEQIRIRQDLILKTQTLERANEELQRYAYIASHDLQEPLRKISTFISMLKQETGNIQDPPAQKYLTKIESGATRMQRLINDVLQFSSLALEEKTIRSLDLNELLVNVLNDLELSIQNHQVRVEVGKLGGIQGNETQIGQLFQNLITNSIKFRTPGRQPVIRIMAQVLPRGDSALANIETANTLPGDYYVKVITVQDNGIGIDESYKEDIFQMFKRLHSRTEYEGTGMGLAICKRIVEFHGGVISVTSTPADGSTFVITLPLNQPDI